MAIKSQTWNINTDQHRQDLVDYIQALPLNEYTATVKNKKQTRSEAQHGLKWVWMNFLAKERSGNEGYTVAGWNWRLKEKFMKPILLEQDTDYHDFFVSYYQIRDALTDQPELWMAYKKGVWSDVLKTEDLHVKGMHQLMTMIDQYCLFKFNIVLPVRDDLFWAYQRGEFDGR